VVEPSAGWISWPSRRNWTRFVCGRDLRFCERQGHFGHRIVGLHVGNPAQRLRPGGQEHQEHQEHQEGQRSQDAIAHGHLVQVDDAVSDSIDQLLVTRRWRLCQCLRADGEHRSGDRSDGQYQVNRRSDLFDRIWPRRIRWRLVRARRAGVVMLVAPWSSGDRRRFAPDRGSHCMGHRELRQLGLPDDHGGTHDGRHEP